MIGVVVVVNPVVGPWLGYWDLQYVHITTANELHLAARHQVYRPGPASNEVFQGCETVTLVNRVRV